jgi:hypothetical protein
MILASKSFETLGIFCFSSSVRKLIGPILPGPGPAINAFLSKNGAALAERRF